MNLDKISVIDIGTSFLDKEKLEHKFITQHKWNDRFYRANEWYVFVPHTGLDCFTSLYDIIFSEIRKIDSDINLMSMFDEFLEIIYLIKTNQQKLIENLI